MGLDCLGIVENLSSVKEESSSWQTWPFVISGVTVTQEWLLRSSGIMPFVLKTEVPVLNSLNLTQNHNYNCLKTLKYMNLI